MAFIEWKDDVDGNRLSDGTKACVSEVSDVTYPDHGNVSFVDCGVACGADLADIIGIFEKREHVVEFLGCDFTARPFSIGE